jgi:hypothetical protein
VARGAVVASVRRVVELKPLAGVKIAILDFDTYNDLDWEAYDVEVTAAFTEERARSEYYDRLAELTATLKRLGSHDAFGEGDFATGSDWNGPHRSLAFTITGDRLLTPELIPAVQSLLRSFPRPYMVEIGYDPFLNGSRHGLGPHDFFATVEHDSVTITTDNDLVLSLLGLQGRD